MQNQYLENLPDEVLVTKTLEGSSYALEVLVKRHQHFIYNVAHKMILSPFDAEDITQEVLIKVITKLSQFEGKSNFRTWIYRITFNHVLQMKKHWLEDAIVSFESYGQELANMPDQNLSEQEEFEMREWIQEAKLGCMAGMLLCLSREQRAVYILGELFEITHQIGAEILDISPDNFRQRLTRARKDLYQFMQNKCGLINTKNPCRCVKKTKAMIEAGWVDFQKMKFNTAYLKTIQATLPAKSEALDDLLASQYAQLFKAHPFQEKPHWETLMKSIFENAELKRIFDF
jgi:RNA polymerase sigma factor (sigma-70 family)